MNGYCWKEEMTPQEESQGAYWERNMLAVKYATRMNEMLKLVFASMHAQLPDECINGWYEDTENNWEGWHRVISLDSGEICFHIPDDFDIGNLPKIKSNWDGHTTKQKWDRIAKSCGMNKLRWNDNA